jgi:hypothetical protein
MKQINWFFTWLFSGNYQNLMQSFLFLNKDLQSLAQAGDKGPNSVYGRLMKYLDPEAGSYAYLFTDEFIVEKNFHRFENVLTGFILQSDTVPILHVIDVAIAIRAKNLLLNYRSNRDSWSKDKCKYSYAALNSLLSRYDELQKKLELRRMTLTEKLGTNISLNKYLENQLFDLDQFCLSPDQLKVNLATAVNHSDRKDLLKTAEVLLLRDSDTQERILEAMTNGLS